MINYSEGKNLVKIWGNDIEDSAMEQVKNLSNLPFVHKHISIMPDNHAGYGCPIGTVIGTKGVVVPNLIGVDIGCGMCAIRTDLKEIDTEILKKIMGNIRELIPLGFDHQKQKQDEKLMPCNSEDTFIVNQQYNNALTQLGTLGGGNHFIEVQKEKDNEIWIMIHSGSRNLGYKVAHHYNKIAIELNEKYYSSIPKNQELAFLPIGSIEAKSYLKEMQYCVDFALASRKLMMERIKEAFYNNIDIDFYGEMINIAHNYAVWENHFNKNVVVHRKGATLAREGTVGIIPGSQGTSSYIVEGLGNKDSFESCSHGAGRLMSRTKAKSELNLKAEIKKLDDRGIIHGIRNSKDLDEASGAYKDIDKVMDNQKDLVKILHKLEPLAVIKG